jgi:hypothetical protein
MWMSDFSPGLSSAGLARPGCQMALGLHPTARAGALGWLWARKKKNYWLDGVRAMRFAIKKNRTGSKPGLGLKK